MKLALFLFAWGTPLFAGDCLTPSHRIVQLRVAACEPATDASLTRFVGAPASVRGLLGSPLAQALVVTGHLERWRLPSGPWKASPGSPTEAYLYRGVNGCAVFPVGSSVRRASPTDCRCDTKAKNLCTAVSAHRLLYDVEPQRRNVNER